MPPMVFVFTYQRAFFICIEYTGAFVAVLRIFLPPMMAWKLKENSFYQSFSNKGKLLLSFVFAFFIIVVDVLEQWGAFKPRE